ncbi:MAG TPA: hypothetical protein VJN90_09560 [Candidatus Acidoferrales bacterium]|nr:hypothetical protein [Candidatus Acidoferrales bacterium]
MKTIKDVEIQVEEKFCETLKDLGLLQDGYTCSVRFHGEKKDKKRTASFEKSWSPETDSIRIQFKAISEEAQAEPQPVAQAAAAARPNDFAKSTPPVVNPLSDMVHALDRAESRPGYSFVALKWFRDVALPSEGFSWASVDSVRNILRDAIDRRLILLSKMPNPKSPQFPVTAIRLNRLMPEVISILGIGSEGVHDFRPIAIRGENLSATVLGDRR